jgi:ABC-type sulfate transport system permease subunit
MAMLIVLLLFRDRIGDLIEAINGPQLLVAIMVTLLVVDIAVLILAAFSFRRSKLAWN